MIINFGEWLPDVPILRNPGCSLVNNVRPIAGGYEQFNDLSSYTTALTAACQGAASAKDKDGNAYNYAGDATALYSLTTNTYNDVSLVGGYTTGAEERWEFEKWGEQVLATNWNDDIQTITMGGANFADLAGTPPRCRTMAAVRDFLFLGNIYDATDGAVPHRIHWSAINDITDWTPSVSTQSDYQDLVGGGGWVQRIIGGEFATIFQEHSIQIASYSGPPTIFRIDEVEKGRGTPAPGSVVKLGKFIFYLGQDGFYYFDGGSNPIGKNKIDNYFWNDVDSGSLHLMSAAVDPVNSLIIWAYPSSGSSIANKLLIYNWSTDRWAPAEVDIEVMVDALSSGYTMETLDTLSADLDALTIPLDSRFYTGGNSFITAFGSDHAQASFEGAALTAVFQTGEFQPFPDRKGTIRELRPLVSGGTHSCRLASRGSQSDAITWAASIPQSPSGRFATRKNSRYFRVEVSVSGGFESALGVNVLGKPRGKR